MKKALVIYVVFLVAVTMAGNYALAGDQQGKEQEPPQISAEEMQAWQKAATPGVHHKHFAESAGSWDAQCKYWIAPDTEPQTADLKAEFEAVFDGRYLVQKLEGQMMGMPFKGMGISGFDNVKGKHTMVWFDNMSTAILYSEGDCSESCAVQTQYMTQKNAMTGKDEKVKTVTRIIDKDKQVFEYFMVNEDGTEFKTMEIVYTRM